MTKLRNLATLVFSPVIAPSTIKSLVRCICFCWVAHARQGRTVCTQHVSVQLSVPSRISRRISVLITDGYPKDSSNCSLYTDPGVSTYNKRHANNSPISAECADWSSRLRKKNIRICSKSEKIGKKLKQRGVC